MAARGAVQRCGYAYHICREGTLSKHRIAYFALLTIAIVFEYTAELHWGAKLALSSRPLVPWVIDAIAYAVLGGFAWLTLPSGSASLRILMLALIAVVPHVLFDMTHGSDPAYPYIGLVFIIPDVLWVAIGAAIAFVITRGSSATTR